MKKKKIYKKFLKAANDFLGDVPDESLSSVDGIQITMNQFLQSQGLPPVQIPFNTVCNDPLISKKSFEEIQNDLYHNGIDS